MDIKIPFHYLDEYFLSRKKESVLVDKKGILEVSIPEISASECETFATIQNDNLYIHDDVVYVPMQWSNQKTTNSLDNFLNKLSFAQKQVNKAFLIESYLASGGFLKNDFNQFSGEKDDFDEKNILKIKSNKDSIANTALKKIDIKLIDGCPYRQQNVVLYHKNKKLSEDYDILLRNLSEDILFWDKEKTMDCFYPKTNSYHETHRDYTELKNCLNNVAFGSINPLLFRNDNDTDGLNFIDKERYFDVSLFDTKRFLSNILFIHFIRKMKQNKNFIMESDESINSFFNMKEMMKEICQNDNSSIDCYPISYMMIFGEKMKNFKGDLFKKDNDMISNIIEKINYIENYHCNNNLTSWNM